MSSGLVDGSASKGSLAATAVAVATAGVVAVGGIGGGGGHMVELGGEAAVATDIGCFGKEIKK